MQKLPVLAIYIAFFSTLFLSCAQTGSISGGDKDTIAPLVIRYEPVDKSTNFNTNEIEISFDEFFELKDMEKKFLTSPPMKHKPKIAISGKKLKIEITDTLQENTTYSLNFSDAIRDFNEGNPIKDFNYVFSTGDIIDTLMVTGKTMNAWTHVASENMSVMLYDQAYDSIPFKEIPSFLGRSNDKGEFRITNIRPGKYKLFAIADANDNLKYDQANEQMAFISEIIIPKAESKTTIDTLKVKKLKYNAQSARFDTVFVDSLARRRYTRFTPDSLKLYVFKEDVSNQFILKSGRPEMGKISIIMNQPIDKQFDISLISPNIKSKWYISEKNYTLDTLTYWISDTSIRNTDTLMLAITYPHRDTTGFIKSYADTVEFTFNKPFGFDRNSALKKIAIQRTNIKNNALERNTPLKITFNTPLSVKDKSKIQLYEISDTLYNKLLRYQLSNAVFINKTTDGLREAYRINNKTLKFIFGKPLAKLPVISSGKLTENWYTATLNDTQDTLTLQITNNRILKTDTLPCKIEYVLKGVLGIESTFTDSMKLAEKQSLYKRFGQKSEFTFIQDSVSLRTWNVQFKTEPDGKSFNLEILPEALTDIYNMTSDTIISRFSVSPLSAYGSFVVNFSNLPINSVVDILDEKSNFLRRIELKNKSAELKKTFELMKPGNYILKLWVDENNNSKWDTGNYLKKKQAEKVYFNKEKIVVKSSWDTVIDWKIEQ